MRLMPRLILFLPAYKVRLKKMAIDFDVYQPPNPKASVKKDGCQIRQMKKLINLCGLSASAVKKITADTLS
jgi:predicted nucleic acid-binding Zn ribbon protein